MTAAMIDLLKIKPNELEKVIDFTREEYEAKQIKDKDGIVDFDQFLYKVCVSVTEQKGDIKDAVTLAEGIIAFKSLPSF